MDFTYLPKRLTVGTGLVKPYCQGRIPTSNIDTAALARSSFPIVISRVEIKPALARKYMATDIVSHKNAGAVQAVRDLTSEAIDYPFRSR